MTATITEEKVAPGVAAGCQSHDIQGERCQDLNANDRHYDGGEIGDSSRGKNCAIGDGKLPHNDQHISNSKISHHQNSRNTHQNKHHHEKSQGDEAAYQLVPPDGGWGWMVAFGAFIITVRL